MSSRVTFVIEDMEDGAINIKVDEVVKVEGFSKALTIANHMWKYLETCREQGIFDEL